MRVLFWRTPKRVVDWRAADSKSLYEMWMSAPAEVAAHLSSEATFTAAEKCVAALWSAKQRSNGLRADVHENATGAATILEPIHKEVESLESVVIRFSV